MDVVTHRTEACIKNEKKSLKIGQLLIKISTALCQTTKRLQGCIKYPRGKKLKFIETILSGEDYQVEMSREGRVWGCKPSCGIKFRKKSAGGRGH